MQKTMAGKKEPLIAIDSFSTKAKATQGITLTENESLITLEDLIAHKEKRLTRTLLILVIVVNLMVLISIILCT